MELNNSYYIYRKSLEDTLKYIEDLTEKIESLNERSRFKTLSCHTELNKHKDGWEFKITVNKDGKNTKETS